MGSLGRWLRWLTIWAVATVVLGLATTAVAGWLLPAPFGWVSAMVLASGLMLLLFPSPSEPD